MDDDKNRNADAILDKLIRASQLESKKRLKRPSSDTIAAYLLGIASLKQKMAIRTALLESPSFRREMRDMMNKLKCLDDTAIHVAVEKDGMDIVVPDINILRTGYIIRQAQAKMQQPSWDSPRTLLRPKFYIPIFVTVLIAMIFIGVYPYLFPTTVPVSELAQWSYVENAIDPGLLISNVTRGPAQEEIAHYYDTPRDAALADFRYVLKNDNGKFDYNPVIENTESNMPTHETKFQIYNSDGKLIKDFNVQIPAPTDESIDITAWAIGLPSRNLYEYNLSSGTTRILWTKEMGEWGCITFAYPHQAKGTAGKIEIQGYSTTLGQKF